MNRRQKTLLRPELDAARQLHRSGKLAEAASRYRVALRQYPNCAITLLHLATLLREVGQTDEALSLYRRLAQIEPENAPVHNAIGQILTEHEEWALARQHFARATEIVPGSPAYQNNFANVLKRLGEIDAAEKILRNTIQLHPKLDYLCYNLATLLLERRAFEAAKPWFEKTLTLSPENLKARIELGVCHEKAGQFAAAVEQYKVVLAKEPNNPRAISNLLALRSYDGRDRLLDVAKSVANDSHTPRSIAARMHQSIGKYLDAIGNYAAAFEHFTRSNSMQEARPVADILRTADTIIERYANNKPCESVEHGIGPKPVFVVGMPRSGTTLVEQILTTDPMIVGAGELQHIPGLVRKAEEQGVESGSLAWKRAANSYRTVIESKAVQNTTFVVDKLPINFMHLGGIVRMFPDAKIIRCRRNPLDVGLSCLVEMFSSDEVDLSSLSGIADAIIAEHRLAQHWESSLPIGIFNLRYESLVADFDGVTRELFRFLGLPWHQRCRDFHKSDRSVDTPSRWQVRQPIYTSSVDRWRNYETMLEPLITRLQDEELI